ncbi:Uu.00g098510.m01.CDS01 [Anthostomella pinea]|uniref:Uu.00g098510.m01.CDS01 n=1 Tax=Anthostomella pinea TaxID=933095 RepID=A0AAI8YF55_9PEZI|nr:Uu.00g098510.m01.CDS01 [Anthostomella pinea]
MDIQKQLSIQEEIDLLVEIEDIHDELIILKMVLKDLQAVLRDLGKTVDPLEYGTQRHPRDIAYSPTLGDDKSAVGQLQRIETMENMTRKTTQTQLLSLLDLKQKQASIAEALSSVAYAKQEAEQAAENARQGRTLTLFTVVTIVFLPLSFMAAFFAINIESFSVNNNGKLGLGYVLKYMLGISTGLSVPFIFIALNQDRFSTWLSYLTKLTPGTLWTSAACVLVAVILTVLWTSSLEYKSSAEHGYGQ